jgi:excisionase family DNA binding protein
MNDASETKRLADAINSLASVIAEIIAGRVRRLEQESERQIMELPAKVVDPLLNKKQLAARLGIGLRTVDTWIKKGYLPYIKYGKLVRFRWSEVEHYLERLEMRPRW